MSESNEVQGKFRYIRDGDNGSMSKPAEASLLGFTVGESLYAAISYVSARPDISRYCVVLSTGTVLAVGADGEIEHVSQAQQAEDLHHGVNSELHDAKSALIEFMLKKMRESNI